MSRERDVRLTLRVPAALKKALEERARREMRSVADVVILILSGEIRWRDEPGCMPPFKGMPEPEFTVSKAKRERLRPFSPKRKRRRS